MRYTSPFQQVLDGKELKRASYVHRKHCYSPATAVGVSSSCGTASELCFITDWYGEWRVDGTERDHRRNSEQGCFEPLVSHNFSWCALTSSGDCMRCTSTVCFQKDIDVLVSNYGQWYMVDIDPAGPFQVGCREPYRRSLSRYFFESDDGKSPAGNRQPYGLVREAAELQHNKSLVVIWMDTTNSNPARDHVVQGQINRRTFAWVCSS